MEFKALMHVNLIAKNWDEMVDFYEHKLGLSKVVQVKYQEYANRPDRPEQYQKALKTPDQIMYVYFKINDYQFIELFPNENNLPDDVKWYQRTGLNHFSLLVDQIDDTYAAFKERQIQTLSAPNKGPSGTWQFWAVDPDGNHFEVQQFTADSYQVRGHLDE